MSDRQNDKQRDGKLLSRRHFLKAAGLFAITAGAGLAGCKVTPGTSGQVQPTAVPVAQQYPEVPYPPATPPARGVFTVFTPQEAQVVEMLTARILPGTQEDPGAREAGVVTFIDNLLTFNEGFAEPTYFQPPFAQTYEGDAPPPEAAKSDPTQVVWVKKEELARYGFQSQQTPKAAYRAGLSAVDRYAGSVYNRKFAALSEAEQDRIVADLASGKATGFDKPAAKDFFKLLRDHTIQGMFADPAYGGNRDMAGWKLIGYPGAQRAYTPHDLKTEGHVRAPQSLAMMHHFNPGQPANPDVILPVSGSEEQRSESQPGMQHNMNP